MNTVKLSEPEKVAIAQEIILLKFTLLACLGFGLLGWGVFTHYQQQATVKTQTQATGKTDTGITPQTQSQPPLVITKKPQKPIVIEEGSKAYFCLKNNGGSGCLTRDRFAPNYKVISPPPPPPREKTYEDYLVQYGVRSGGYCGRYFNGEPNCY